MKRLDFILEETRGPVVLDLGAVQHDASNAENEEWVHKNLDERFETVVGVDILADEVRQLREQGYDIRHADVTAMDLDVTADTVVAGELLEHVANPGLMLQRAAAHLRPGGRIVLTTPNPWAYSFLRGWVTGSMSINDEHVAWYGPEVLRQLLDRYGFAVERLQTTRRDHGGLMRVAQLLDNDRFGGTAWCCAARLTESQ